MKGTSCSTHSTYDLAFHHCSLQEEKGKQRVHYTPRYVYVKNLIQLKLCDAVPFNSCSKLGHRGIADKLVCV
jgi:hypothetical protein